MDWSELEAVYERYHQQLYRYCFSIVGNAEDAQDALQNAMVKAVRALPGEQRKIQLKPWLYRIAHNESIELLRRRREQVELGPELASAASGPADAAAQRERLRQLLADLEQLPDRQRGALVMRELSGLGFEQIGEAFGTSAAVARQTVYEARLSLRQLATGREMNCGKVMRELSEADGRVTRRRDIQAHLRDCDECRAFGESIASRRRDLAAIAPLPVAASGALLHSLLGGSKVSAGLGGSVATGVGKTAAGSLAVKSAATVAVVAVLGASVADRSGVIDISGSHGDRTDTERVSGNASSGSAGRVDDEAPGVDAAKATANEANRGGGQLSTGRPAAGGSKGPSSAKAGPNDASPGTAGPAPHELPAASNHGQETAAAHGGGWAQAGSKARGASKGHPNSHAPSKPPGQTKDRHTSAGKGKGHSEPQGQAKGHSGAPGKSNAHPEKGSSANAPPTSKTPAPDDLGPDNAPKAPLQPSETPPGPGSPKG